MPKITDNATAMTQYDFDVPIHQAEEEDDEDLELSEEMAREIERKANSIQPYQEPIETINLGTEGDPKEIKLGAMLEQSVKDRLIKLLQEYIDIFAWSYRDMPGLDTDIVVHRLPLKEGCSLVRQKLRRTHPDMSRKIREEVLK